MKNHSGQKPFIEHKPIKCPKCKSYDIYAVLKSGIWEYLCRKCGTKIYSTESKGNIIDVITKKLSKKFKRMKRQHEEKDVP